MAILAALVGRLAGGSAASVRLPPADTHDIEAAPDRRPRTLKHLLRANHVHHALVDETQPPPRFNVLAHALCAAYLLGGSAHQLHALYDVLSGPLVPWTPSPAEVAEVDWCDFLGEPPYQRAYVDFFEDVYASHHVAYAWRTVVNTYLFAGPEPLVNNLLGGVGHPLVHLAYAFEMDSRILAMEALAMAAVSHNTLHRYLDDPSYTRAPPPALATVTALPDLLARLAKDPRLDGVQGHGVAIVVDAHAIAATKAAHHHHHADGEADPAATALAVATAAAHANGAAALEALFATPAVASALLEYWNAWPTVTDDGDLTPAFRTLQETAVALLLAPGQPTHHLLLGNVLVASRAARVLLPQLPARCHGQLLRQWWLLALAAYVCAQRPPLDADGWSAAPNTPADGPAPSWGAVTSQALTSRFKSDGLFLQVIHTLRDASQTWRDERYLNAAQRFVDDFDGWAG